jgi:hypothetical protein
VSKEEIIRGEEAIREAIQAWRRFLIENWRSEPLRLTTAIPWGKLPFHLVEFQGGRTGWLGYLDNDLRYPLYWGCNVVHFPDGYKPPEKLAIGIVKAYPDWQSLDHIYHYHLKSYFIFDPVLLLFYCLAEATFPDLAKDKPITAREIVERCEQVFQNRKQDVNGNIWVSITGSWYPAELLTVARERL